PVAGWLARERDASPSLYIQGRPRFTEAAGGAPSRTPLHMARRASGCCGVAEDVGVAPAREAILLRRGTRNGGATGGDVLAPRVDRRAVEREARVVPDTDAVGSRGGCVDVVAEELGNEIVLARCSRIAGGATVDLTERAGRCAAAHRRLQEDTDE